MINAGDAVEVAVGKLEVQFSISNFEILNTRLQSVSTAMNFTKV